jgi:hypothetical protein
MRSPRSFTSWRGTRSLVLWLLVIGAAGCPTIPTSTVPITMQSGTAVPAKRIHQPQLTQPSPGNTAKVSFLRDAGALGSACAHEILVDNNAVLAIRAGEYQTLYLAPGQHFFAVDMNSRFCSPGSYKWHSTILRDGAEETYRIFIPSIGSEPQVETRIATTSSFTTPNYEWVVPPERGWTLRFRDRGEPFILTDSPRSISDAADFRIVVLEDAIQDERMRAQPAKLVADEYRKAEENIMVESGVNTGEYTLRNVELGEIEVGGKTFWTMKYQARRLNLTTHATLFLYLPQPSNNEHFLAILYSATVPSNAVPTSEREADLLRVLESVTTR